MQALRIGLVGCGRLAERGYVPALGQAEGAHLAAVADPVLDRCARTAPGIPAFAGADDLIAAGLVDALALATPAEAHLADARLAARAGLPVLVEKPPAANLAEANELGTLEPAPSFAFNRRFVPELVRLRGAVPAHERVEVALEMRARPGSWRAYVVDDDVLLDLGPHLIDLVRWLTGAEITRVRAALTGAAASLELELAAGRGRALVQCSEGPYRERVSVDAGRGRVARYSTGGLLAALRVALRGSSAEHPLVASLARQVEAFARRVRGEPEPDLARPGDGIAVMAALEAARASAAAGGAWTAVEPR